MSSYYTGETDTEAAPSSRADPFILALLDLLYVLEDLRYVLRRPVRPGPTKRDRPGQARIPRIWYETRYFGRSIGGEP